MTREDLRGRRILLVTAGPGYGKTTILRSGLPQRSQHWYDQAAVTQLGAGAPPALPTASPAPPAGGAARQWLIFDGLPRPGADAVRSMLAWLVALPDPWAVALTSRISLPAALTRWAEPADALRLGPAHLRLDDSRIASLLRDEADLHDPALPASLGRATAGWPALVNLAGQTLARARPDTVDTWSAKAVVAAVTQPGTVLAEYVHDEILHSLPAPTRRLVRDLAGLGPVTAPLCRALGHRGADRAVAELLAAGVLTAGHEPAGGYRLVPVVAAVARPAATARATAQLAATWYRSHGPAIAAAWASHDAGDDKGCATLLAERGDEILASGTAGAFVGLVEALPPRLRTAPIRLQWADALRATGDTGAAQAIFDELAGAAPASGYDPALAWRMGALHYLKAEPRRALEVFARADPAAGGRADRVALLAWTATAHWMLGDVEAALREAREAVRLARSGAAGTEAGPHEGTDAGASPEAGPESGAEPAIGRSAVTAADERALVAAHVALAMSLKLTGDAAGTEQHYGFALRTARRVGDSVQAIRILINQTHEHLARARYPQALAVAEQAARVAEAGAPAGMVIVAWCNEAEALGRLGRFDEAIARYARAVPMCQRMGLRRIAVALAGLGDVHRRRGWPQQARAAYEEAVKVARDTGEMQALVPALCGLARVRASDDPREAGALADEAAAHAQGSWTAAACIARGWAALHAGDLAAAADHARQAAHQARLRREPAGLAEALELTAAAASDPEAVRASLTEAHTIWLDCAAALDADRVLATLGTIPGADTAARAHAMLARQRLLAAGVQQEATSVALTASSGHHHEIRIQVLGRFEVRVAGQAVPAAAWQSRKARDLVRILVARRGRMLPREELAELLWPRERASAHRLSVLLSLVRAVLDPQRRRPDQVLLVDRSAVALDPVGVRVDLDDFLEDVAYGCGLYEHGELAAAQLVLSSALAAYGGEPFADEPYPDWTAPAREQARWAYLRAHRTLARLDRHRRRTDEAVGHLLAILEHDPYDEDAHRMLTGALADAGRHGEARRAWQRYHDAMLTIGVPPPDEGQPRITTGLPAGHTMAGISSPIDQEARS